MSNIQKGIDIIEVDVNKNQETLMEIVNKIRIQQSTTTSSNTYDLTLLKMPVADLEESGVEQARGGCRTKKNMS